MHLMTNIRNGSIIVIDYDVHGVQYCSDAVLSCPIVLSAFYEHKSSGRHPIHTKEVRSSVFSVDPRRLW